MHKIWELFKPLKIGKELNIGVDNKFNTQKEEILSGYFFPVCILSQKEKVYD